jgi:hypothetical protein
MVENWARTQRLGLLAVGAPEALPGRELVIERGNLVQPVDDLFVCHRGRVAASAGRFLAEERGVGRKCGVWQGVVVHVDLTFGLRGTIHPFERQLLCDLAGGAAVDVIDGDRNERTLIGETLKVPAVRSIVVEKIVYSL